MTFRANIKHCLQGLFIAALWTAVGARPAAAQVSGTLNTPVVESAANQYISVNQGVSGTQYISYPALTGADVDLTGKWTVTTTGGDPLIPLSSNAPLSGYARDPTALTLGGSSSYLSMLVDGPLTLTGGQIPGYNMTTIQNSLALTTAPVSPTNGFEIGQLILQNEQNGNNNNNNNNNNTNNNNNNNTTGAVIPSLTEYAIEFGTGGWTTPSVVETGALTAQNIGNNNNSSTTTVNATTLTVFAQQPVVNQTSNTVTSVWIDPYSYIAVICFLTVMRDTVRVQYSAFNEDTIAHTIGFKLNVSPYTVNWVSSAFTDYNSTNLGWIQLPGYGLQASEARYDSSQIPSQWLAYDALPNYALASRMIMSGPKDATPPSHLIVAGALAPDIGSQDYVYKWGGNRSVRDPASPYSACIEYWDPQTVAPNASYTIVQYYGLAGAQEDFSPPFVLASESSAALAYDEVATTGSGTSTTGTSTTGTTTTTTMQYSPNPVSTRGFVYNMSGFYYNSNPVTMLSQGTSIPVTVNDATATLSLGSGLTIPTGQATTQSLGSLANQSEGQAIWSINPAGYGAGAATFQVSGGGNPAGTKAVLDTIQLPATPNGVYYSAGWQMVTFPFTYTGLEFQDLLPILTTGQGFLARWDPQDGTYHYFNVNNPDPYIETPAPGAAYWLYVNADAITSSPFTFPASEATPLALQSDTSGTSGAGTSTSGGTSTPTTESITLYQGWNQVANPYVYSLVYAETSVLYNGQTYSISSAVANGILSETSLYGYDTGSNLYYLVNPDLTSQVLPLVGYWIYCSVTSASLVFTAPPIPNAQIIPPVTTSALGS